jgi:hypothetical protein
VNLDFNEEEILVDAHSKSDESMILGSQRSPSNKKSKHKSNRRWVGSNKSALSNDIFGNSFDGMSSMGKFNQTAGNGKDLDLKNVEFEVSYDFTQEIKEQAKMINRKHKK